MEFDRARVEFVVVFGVVVDVEDEAVQNTKWDQLHNLPIRFQLANKLMFV